MNIIDYQVSEALNYLNGKNRRMQWTELDLDTGLYGQSCRSSHIDLRVVFGGMRDPVQKQFKITKIWFREMFDCYTLNEHGKLWLDNLYDKASNEFFRDLFYLQNNKQPKEA